jgi:hypothetical protein
MKIVVSLPAIVLSLSVASHGLLLLAPMPQSTEADIALSADSEASGELSVVVLSPPEPPAEPGIASTEVVNGSLPSATVEASPESPLQTKPMPEPAIAAAIPEPSLPEDTGLPESDPPPETPDRPLEEGPPLDGREEEIEPQYGDPITPESVGPLMGYGDTFPHFEGAVGGCFGFVECRRVSGVGSYRAVARSLVASLEAQGYGVDRRDDLDDTGRNVYELMAPDGDAIQYLLVFSDIDGSAIYVMSDEIMTLHDLQTLQAQSQANRHSG